MGLAEKLKSTKPKGNELGRISYTPGGVFDLILASVFINLLALAMPLTLLQVYDRIIPNSAEGTLILLIVGVGSALILEACLRQGRSYVGGWMGARFEHLAGVAAVERLLNVSIVDYERQGSGVHLERFNALGPLKEFYAGQAILALCDLPFAVLFLGAMYYLAGHLVLVPIALIIFFAIAAIVVGKKLRDALENRMMADDRRYSFIIEVLGGIHTVKGLAMEEQMIRRYERLQETCAAADYNVALQSSSASSTGALFSQLVLFCVVGYGATFVIDGVLTVGGLAACTMLAGRSMQPLQKAVGIWTRFQSIQLSLDRVRELFQMQGAGDKLPKGIKQRIAIARALVDKPRVLLFDEANASMDSAGDSTLRNLLERLKGRVTLILVTPRPSMLNLADRIFDINDSQLVERVPEGEKLGSPFGKA